MVWWGRSQIKRCWTPIIPNWAALPTVSNFHHHPHCPVDTIDIFSRMHMPHRNNWYSIISVINLTLVLLLACPCCCLVFICWSFVQFVGAFPLFAHVVCGFHLCPVCLWFFLFVPHSGIFPTIVTVAKLNVSPFPASFWLARGTHTRIYWQTSNKFVANNKIGWNFKYAFLSIQWELALIPSLQCSSLTNNNLLMFSCQVCLARTVSWLKRVTGQYSRYPDFLPNI